MRMRFFGSISLVRVFTLHISEFLLSCYRSSKYFLAVDFQLPYLPVDKLHPEFGTRFSGKKVF